MKYEGRNRVGRISEGGNTGRKGWPPAEKLSHTGEGAQPRKREAETKRQKKACDWRGSRRAVLLPSPLEEGVPSARSRRPAPSEGTEDQERRNLGTSLLFRFLPYLIFLTRNNANINF